MFRHTAVVCVCLVCILWQFSMLHDLSLLMLVEDARCDHMEEAYPIADLVPALEVAMSVCFCLPHPVTVSVLSFVVDCVLVLRCCEFV